MSKTVSQLATSTLPVSQNDTFVMGQSGTFKTLSMMQMLGQMSRFPQVEFQPNPATQNTTATLTLAQVQARIIVSTPAATITLTLPTGTTLNDYIDPFLNDTAFEITFINTSPHIITIAPNTGVTIVGAASVAANTSAHFRIRRVGPGSYVSYRT